MYHQITAFVKFLFSSTTEHGVHSPFVYDLAINCLHQKTPVKTAGKIRAFKRELLQNQRTVAVTDFGAGSKKMKKDNRKVAHIAKSAGISYKRALLLNRLIAYFKVRNALEIGTSVGISAAAMAMDNPNCNLITLEGCKNTAEIAKKQFEKFDLTNITVKIGRFETLLPQILTDQTYDLVFFDGNHQKEATLRYFEQCLPAIHNDSIFVFDDIYWSKGMAEAWNTIKTHPKVTVSIDTYQWGIVFFRKEQAKEHFTLRI